ncbi:hypothetical protein WJW27_004717 [Escherichia coli]|nr:hypothetical protein vBEcoMphAPEC6_01140 [Escherichia phage ph0011]
MAKTISLKNEKVGQRKDGFYGFSWTTLFFGPFPALFRGDFITFIGAFVIYFILNAVSFWIVGTIAMVVWAFIYNKYYTVNLIKNGYKFNGTHEENAEAAMALQIDLNKNNTVDKNKDPE